MKKHQKYMRLAMGLAERGRLTVSPNPMVGALIVKSGRVIAQGWHRRCGGDHAEVIVLKKAGRRAKGAAMYVTLEPCHHYGRTPPCVDAVIKGGIKEIFIGMRDPNPKTNGRSIRKLRAAGIKVHHGILEDQLRRLNEVFITYITRKRPFIIAKSAQTLDGKIATSTGHSQWITSEQSRRFARQERNRFDGILVGVNTVIRDNPRLTAGHPSKRLKRIVVDSNLRVPERAKVLTQARDCIIATTHRASGAKVQRLEKRGAQILMAPSAGQKVSLPWLFKELARREISSVLIEGGATVIGQALKDKLVDKMIVYLAPKILGDQRAVSSVDGFQLNNVNRLLRLKDWQWRAIGPDMMMEGYVDYVYRTR